MAWPWRRWLFHVAELITPNRCWLCLAGEAEGGPIRHGLCSRCWKEVTSDAHHLCRRCAATIGAFTEGDQACSTCHAKNLHLDSTVRLGPYEGLLRDIILMMKTPMGEGLAEQMGHLLAEVKGEELRSKAVHLVTCVPMYWYRRWQRGHNQADRLARCLSQSLHLRYIPHLLCRRHGVAQEVQPTASARWQNVRQAFSLQAGANLKGQRILVVDDVMTTGATLSAIAQLLRRAGAEEVHAAILARA